MKLQNLLLIVMAATIMRVVFVTDMDCPKCAKKVTENVSFEKGVRDLSVDIESGTVAIEYRADLTDTLKLGNAIRKLGYSAKVVELVKVEKKK